MRYVSIVGRTAVACCLSLLTGCATAAVPSPPEARHPNPTTVTKENPAGDAREPEDAALTRLLSLPIGTRFDRFQTLGAAYADVSNWRRVRIWGHPTRVTYRYGDEHFAIDLVDYRQAAGDDTADGCLRAFVDRARDEAERYHVDIGPIERGVGQHRRGVERPGGEPMSPMPYLRVSGSFTTLFARDRYLAAIAGYRSWPGTCLVHAFAVRVGTDEELARKVIDRWVEDLAPRLEWADRLQNAPSFEDR